MKLRTALFLTAFASPWCLGDGWVVLDVRHADYGDRLRLVLDLDRNQAVTSTLEYQSLGLAFPKELRRVTCTQGLPPSIDLSWDADSIQLNWQGQWWGESFQLSNPPRQVVDLHRRVGDEKVKPAPQPRMLANHCQH